MILVEKSAVSGLALAHQAEENDGHPPPHFHAIYGDSEAQVGISPIAILESNLPRRAISMVVEWATLHQGELMANWRRLREDQPAEKIPPLD